MTMSRKILMTISLCFIFTALFSFAVFATGDGGFSELDIRTVEERLGNAAEETDGGELAGGGSEVVVIDAESDVEATEEVSVLDSEVLECFELTSEAVYELVDISEAVSYSVPVYSSNEVEERLRERLKDMGDLTLVTGFQSDKVTTFSDAKFLEGDGEVGVKVGLYVFHFEDVYNSADELVDQELIVTQDHLVEVGASGMYSETVELDYIGVNYVLLATVNPETDEEPVVRLFKVCREERVKRDLLENVQIDFFEEEEESPTLDGFVPNFLDIGL